MNEERRRILQMLTDRAITADEAERLIEALGAETTASATRSAETPSRKAKFLRVLVDTDEDDGPTKVNIRVPMQLLRAGVRLGALIPVHAREPVNRALSQQGINFDVGQIKPENLNDLVEHLSELTVDLDQERTKVRVFCE
jgi:hypothetical protein